MRARGGRHAPLLRRRYSRVIAKAIVQHRGADELLRGLASLLRLCDGSMRTRAAWSAARAPGFEALTKSERAQSAAFGGRAALAP